MVLAVALLAAMVLLYVEQAAYTDLRNELAKERADHARTSEALAAVEAELTAPVPFTVAGHIEGVDGQALRLLAGPHHKDPGHRRYRGETR